MKYRVLESCLVATLALAATPLFAQSAVITSPPPVITPLHGPGQCLDLSLDNQMGDFVQLWQCWPGWNQAFRYDNDRSILWVGGSTCLQSTGNNGDRVVMRPCDGSAQQTWQQVGTRFVDFGGKCLDAYGGGAGNGTWVIVWECTDGALNQQWKVSTLDAEYVRADGVTTPPALLPAYGVQQYGDLPYWLEQDRPRFNVRNLTRAERSEASELARPYMKANVLAHYNDREDLTHLSVPWATIKRLAELAESGDKDLMHSLLQVMRVALSIHESNSYGGSRYDPMDDGSFAGEDLYFAWLRLNQLTIVWSAHYWQRHGADRLAAYAFIECWPSNERCGYTYTPVDWDGKYLPNYAETGSRRDLIKVEDIRFWPVDGDNAWRQTRFETLLGYLPYHYGGSNYKMTDADYAWMEWYGRASGQLDTFRYAWTQHVWADERFRSAHEIYYRSQVDMARWAEQFEQEILRPEPSNYLNMLIQQMGDEYLLRYAERFEPENESQIDRICELGSPDCTRHRAAFDQRVAEAALRREEEARQAAAISAQYQQQNRLVTVRQYDQNGNYTGSRVDTALGAELSGARP